MSNSAADAVIQARGLTKRYGSFVAVDGLDLEIRAGEVYGLLGPNGSGKTTTILMLLGLTERDAGEIEVLGLDPRRNPISVKRQVGYLPDSVGFYDEFTARENLRYTARLNGMPDKQSDATIASALQRMGLAEVMDKRVAAFSRGMRQRLGLAEVLMRAPRIAILDEPTLGLDPTGALEFLELVRSLKHEGITVLLSSHHLQQVQAVCDRVGLFYKGKLVLNGTVDALAREVLGAGWRVHLEAGPGTGDGNLAAALQAVPGVRSVTAGAGDAMNGKAGHWLIESESDVRPALVRAATRAGADVRGLNMEQASLDEVYARYFETRGQARGAGAQP